MEGLPKQEELTGVERIYNEAKEQILRIMDLRKQDVETILNDPEFMKEVTRTWQEDLAKAEDPEEKEKQLRNGLIFRIKEKIATEQSN
ncbi:hypothetical protein KKB69_03130 [Patescibacteria group bacterium]|nr:hypothetical protein [Patescibacteria group bacterium]